MTWGTNVVGLMLGLTSTAFMSLRIYAIWNMDRRIFVVVFVSGIVLPFIEFYLAGVSFANAAFPVESCATYRNLSWTKEAILFIVGFVFGIISDCIVLVLTCMKTIQAQRSLLQLNTRNNLVYQIQRDGTIYFLVFLVLDVVTLTAAVLQVYENVFIFSKALQPIFTSYFFFNLRDVHQSGPHSITSTSTSSMRFADNLVGNLGAPLDDLFADFSDDQSGDDRRITIGITESSQSVAALHLEDIQELSGREPELEDLKS